MKFWAWLESHPRIELAAAACVGAILAGLAVRYGLPTRVEERERVVERLVVDEKTIEARVAAAKVTWEKDIQDHTRVVTRYVEGKVVERVEYRDRDTHAEGAKVEVKTVTVEVEKRVEVEKLVEKEKIVTREAPRLAVYGTVGIPFGSGSHPLQYGGAVTIRILGPVHALAAGSGGAEGGQGTIGLGIAF